MKKIVLLGLLKFLVLGIFTLGFARENLTLEDLVEKTSEVTKKTYLYSTELKGKVVVTNKELLKPEKIEGFLSESLYLNGYTRITSDKGHYNIIPARDIRYSATRQFEVGKKGTMNLPDSHDYVMVTYNPTHQFSASEVTRAMRPFMSRYGRIIHDKITSRIILQDTVPNVKRLVELIRKFDVQPTKAQMAKWKEDRTHRQNVELAEAKSCGSLKEEVKTLMNQLQEKK